METEARAHALDDLLLAAIRVGGHTLLVDETFSEREHMGCWSVGLLMGALAADTVLVLRRAAVAQQLPLRGIEVQAAANVERYYGEGPSYPSSSPGLEPYWGRVAKADRVIRLWGDLGPSELEGLHEAAQASPVARSLANPAVIEDRIERNPRQ